MGEQTNFLEKNEKQDTFVGNEYDKYISVMYYGLISLFKTYFFTSIPAADDGIVMAPKVRNKQMATLIFLYI